MKKKAGIYKIEAIAYTIVAVLFIIFFIYIGIFENVSITQTREEPYSTLVDNVTVTEIEDEQTPVGMKKEYSWIMDEENATGCMLAFYVIHQYVQVFIDDELVYSVEPGDNNRIIRSPGNYWVTVPIYPEDFGKECRVVVTPAYKVIKDRSLEFHYGSLYLIYREQLKKDLPQLILALICIFTGAVFVIAQCVLYVRKKSRDMEFIWIGMFSALLGIWRFTDTRFTPWMFDERPALAAYLALGALFLIVVPVLFFIKTGFVRSKTPILNAAVFIGIAAAAVALFCQVTGIAELRELITLCHVTVILGILVILITVIRHRSEWRGKFSPSVVAFAAALSGGAIADLLLFYVRETSSNTIFMMTVFLIYMILLFGVRMQENMRQAYTDANTGLFNKRRWDVIMREDTGNKKPIGIMMLDLNGLKVVNDTMGHYAGDKMIFNFANILRNTIPPTNVICRWGGDEFTVFITEASKEKMEEYIAAIRKAADVYNASGEKPELNYAAGYVLSDEFPQTSRKNLLKIADERMYEDKKKWYSDNNIKKK